MPTYIFHNSESGETFEMWMKMTERDQFLRDNPHVQSVLTAPAIVSGVSTSSQNRVPNGFKEVLSKIAETHPNSTVGEKHGNKSIKQIKTQQVVKNHVERVTGVKI
jgi:hypothetical protein